MKKEKKEADYLIFARKFRPETFEAVVGQEALTQILRNAIRTGRIPQSFLFTGPRGIGKTSTARILAKALNCAKGPAEEPCNQCPNCGEITRAISLDVLEIDGASNRGIEEIRTLRENVKFKPAQSRFKIYVIDEVHMLTGEAFNALLKTLEEPPSHVKFIFATTEPHKVPLTILSRCQRFNFKRIPAQRIAAKLSEIAQAEGLKPEPQALFLIARASDGSLRDAETLLDQLGSLSPAGEILASEVLFALGLAGEEFYFELLEALRKKNAPKVLSLVRGLYESGKDLAPLGRGLYELFRNLLLQQIGGGAEALIEMNEESKKELFSFKELFSREELLLILTLFQNLQGDLRRALAPPELLLEIALLKILHLEGLHEVKELLEKAEAISPDSGQAPQSSGSEIASSPPAVAPRPPAGEAGNDETTSLSLSVLHEVWPRVVEAVKAKEMSTGMFLAEAEPVEMAAGLLTLALPEEFQFHKEMLERAEKKKLIEEALSQFLGPAPRIQFVTTRLSQGEAPPQAEGAPQNPKLPEIVRQAIDIFRGSKVIRAD